MTRVRGRTRIVYRRLWEGIEGSVICSQMEEKREEALNFTQTPRRSLCDRRRLVKKNLQACHQTKSWEKKDEPSCEEQDGAVAGKSPKESGEESADHLLGWDIWPCWKGSKQTMSVSWACQALLSSPDLEDHDAIGGAKPTEQR